MNLIILKTNIKTKRMVRAIQTFFDFHPNIKRWTIDLEDIDKVLRIETNGNLTERETVQMIESVGFYGEALPD